MSTAGKKKRAGQCLCGAVHFTATTAPEMGVCHCGMCRRWTGGIFMGVHCDDVEIDDIGMVSVYRSSEWGERLFCRRCGTSLFWRMSDRSSWEASVQTFDDASDFAFARESFIDEKPTNYDFAGERTRRTGAEFLASVTGEGQA